MAFRFSLSVAICLVWLSTDVALVQSAQVDKEATAELDKLGKPSAPSLTMAGTVVDAADTPVAAATVHVVNELADIDAHVDTDDKGKFELRLRLDPRGIFSLNISANSKDKSQLAFYRVPYAAEPTPPQDIKLQLGPTKLAKLKVVGADGRPIESANVALQLGFPVVVGPVLTDATGSVSIQLPATETINSVVAWKAGAGLDYKLYFLPQQQAADQLAKKPTFPIDAVESLTLDGVQPLSVRVTDRQGKPIADSHAYVWLLQKPGSSDQLNLSYFIQDFAAEADSDGRIVFDWFPKWQADPITIWPMADSYVHQRAEYDPTSKTGSVEIQLESLIPLRGSVTYPDGKPAANIAVSAHGAGYSMDRFNQVDSTDEAGRYEIMAAPNQIYMLNIVDKDWAAPSQSGFVVLPGKEVEEHNFVLRKSTRLFGKLLDKATGEPVAGKTVFLTLDGVSLNELGEAVLPNPEKSNMWVCPMWQQTVTPGEDGAFEFFVGDGQYNLFTQGFDVEKVQVAQELEKHIDLFIAVQAKKKFSGSVVAGQSKTPVEAARLHVFSTDLREHNEWRGTTTSDGKFKIAMLAEPALVQAISSDSKLGTIVELDEDKTSLELQLAELGSATGQLLTEDGSGPAAGVKLLCAIRIWDSKKQFSTSQFGKVVTTGEKGEFMLPNLIPGWEYECTLLDHPGGYVLTAARVKVEPGESKTLGALKTPGIPKPYAPPTLAERTEAAFKIAGTALERFERARQLIKQVNQNLLIVLSSPSDSRVKSLMEIRFEDQAFRPYQDDYRFMAIPTDDDKLDAARELAKTLDLPALEDKGCFWLVVINADGEVVSKINSDQVCDGERISKDRLFAELDKHKTTPLDAHQLLKEALEKAERENKRVLLQETATWCGPCQMLSRWLLANRQWEKDYIWVKMDHRWTGAIEIMRELRGEAQGGIPWCVILDSKGNKLATSNAPKSGDNIGYPSEEEGQKHFANMLKSTCQRMTEQEIADLIKATSVD